VTSLGAVADQLRRIADQLPVTHIGDAVDRAEEAAAIMAEACAGTTQADLIEVTASFTEAHSRACELLTAFLALRATIHALANKLAPDRARGSHSPPTAADRIDDIRRSLPPGFDGAQAQGRWLGPGTDVTVVRSGVGDEWYDKAVAFIRSVAGPTSPVINLARHIEVKLAVRMRDEGRKHEVVIIDRQVCGRRTFDRDFPTTCDKYLKYFLKKGTSITVVEQDGTQVTYQGVSER